MKLYFQNESGKRSLIANPINRKEAHSEISKFCKERNFEIYYIRSINKAITSHGWGDLIPEEEPTEDSALCYYEWY